MKKCIKCNVENDDNALVCSSCGTRLSTNETIRLDKTSFFTTPLVLAEDDDTSVELDTTKNEQSENILPKNETIEVVPQILENISSKKSLDKKKLGIIGGSLAAIIIVLVCILVIPNLLKTDSKATNSNEISYYNADEFFFMKEETTNGDKYALFDIYGNQYSDFIYNYYENEDSYSWDDEIEIDTSLNYIKALKDDDTYDYYSLDGKLINYDTEKYTFDNIYNVNNKKAVVLTNSNDKKVLSIDGTMYETNDYYNIIYNGKAFIVVDDNNLALFDSNFDKLTDFIYSNYELCDNSNFIKLEKNDKYVLYDISNKKELYSSDMKIKELLSGLLEDESSELFLITNNDTQTVYNEKGKVIIDNIYSASDYNRIDNMHFISALNNEDNKFHLYTSDGKDLGTYTNSTNKMPYYYDGKIIDLDATNGSNGEKNSIFYFMEYEDSDSTVCNNATFTVYKEGKEYTTGEISIESSGHQCRADVSDVYEIGNDIYYAVSIYELSVYKPKIVIYKNKEVLTTFENEYSYSEATDFDGIVLFKGKEYIIFDGIVLYDKNVKTNYIIADKFDDGTLLIDVGGNEDSEYYLIDKDGKQVNESPYYSTVDIYDKNLLAVQEKKNGNYEIINTKGELISKEEYKEAYSEFDWSLDYLDDIFYFKNLNDEEVITDLEGNVMFKTTNFKGEQEAFDNRYMYSGDNGIYTVYDVNNKKSFNIDITKTTFENKEYTMTMETFKLEDQYYKIEAYYGDETSNVALIKTYYYSYLTNKNFYTKIS